MMTAAEFSRFTKQATDGYLWLDYQFHQIGQDAMILAGQSVFLGIDFDIYIRNCHRFLVGTIQKYLLEMWIVDREVHDPFYFCGNELRFFHDDTMSDYEYIAVTGTDFFVCTEYIPNFRTGYSARGMLEILMYGESDVEIENLTPYQRLVFD
jgi:hypothetical protein